VDYKCLVHDRKKHTTYPLDAEGLILHNVDYEFIHTVWYGIAKPVTSDDVGYYPLTPILANTCNFTHIGVGKRYIKINILHGGTRQFFYCERNKSCYFFNHERYE